MPLLPASKIDIGHLPLLFRGHFEQAVGIQGFPARRFHRLTELAHGGAHARDGARPCFEASDRAVPSADLARHGAWGGSTRGAVAQRRVEQLLLLGERHLGGGAQLLVERRGARAGGDRAVYSTDPDLNS